MVQKLSGQMGGTAVSGTTGTKALPRGQIRRSRAELNTIADTVISAFALDGESYGVTELSRSLGLSKATVHRALTTLAAQGTVKREEARARARARYVLSHQDDEPQDLFGSRPCLRALCVSAMHDFHRLTSERVSVSLRQADRIVFVDRIEACWPVIWQSAIGHLRPLIDWSASSRIVLSCLQDLEVEAQIRRRISLGSSKQDPIGWVETLWRDIEVIRRRGYALIHRAPSPRLIAAAFPVLSADNIVQGAISVGGPVERFEQQLEAVLPRLKSIAAKLNRRTRSN